MYYYYYYYYFFFFLIPYIGSTDKCHTSAFNALIHYCYSFYSILGVFIFDSICHIHVCKLPSVQSSNTYIGVVPDKKKKKIAEEI